MNKKTELYIECNSSNEVEIYVFEKSRKVQKLKKIRSKNSNLKHLNYVKNGKDRGSCEGAGVI